jgi:hypothetical protein
MAAVSPGGRFLAAFDRDHPGVSLWDLETSSPPAVVLAMHRVSSAAFSPDERDLIVDTGQEVLRFDLANARVTSRVPLVEESAPPSWRGALSSAGDLVALSRPGYSIHLVDWRRRKRVATLPAERPNAAVALGPDGRQLLSTGADFALQSWDLGAIRDELNAWGLDW